MYLGSSAYDDFYSDFFMQKDGLVGWAYSTNFNNSEGIFVNELSVWNHFGKELSGQFSAIKLIFDDSENTYLVGLYKDPIFDTLSQIVIKYNKIGTVKWVVQLKVHKKYADCDYAGCISVDYKVFVDKNFNVYVSDKLALSKIDSTGKLIWTKFIPGTFEYNKSEIYCLQSMDPVIWSGTIGMDVNHTDTIKLLKIDTSGNIKASKNIIHAVGNVQQYYGNWIRSTEANFFVTSNSILIYGNFWGQVSFNPTNDNDTLVNLKEPQFVSPRGQALYIDFDPFVAEYDTLGNLVKFYRVKYQFEHATLDNDKNLFGSYTIRDTSSQCICISKFNQDGVLIWEKRFSGIGEIDIKKIEYFSNISENTNNIVLAGNFKGNVNFDLSNTIDDRNWVQSYNNSWDAFITIYNENEISSSIKLPNIIGTLSVHPNPAKDFIQINNSNINGYSLIKIFNVEGEMIYCKDFEGTDVKIDISAYKSGVYFTELSHVVLHVDKICLLSEKR